MTGDEPAREAELVPGAEDPQELSARKAFEQLVDLERQRIESTNRRTEIALKAIEASDAADKRQYEYHVERLRQRSRARNERHRSIVKFAWAALATVVLAGGFVVSMLFFGNEAQRMAAQDILRTVATAVGGAGALWALMSALRRMFENNSRDE